MAEPRKVIKMSMDEFNDLVRSGRPPTDDDVPIAIDGRRLDTREKLLEYLVEIGSLPEDYPIYPKPDSGVA